MVFAPWGPLGRPLGGLLGRLGASGSRKGEKAKNIEKHIGKSMILAFRGPLGRPLGGLLGRLGGLLGRLGPILGVLGRSLGISGASWAVLGASWAPRRPSWGFLRPEKVTREDAEGRREAPGVRRQDQEDLRRGGGVPLKIPQD